ncbi:unnamed protein product [Penicillium nalgiovense]|uniref:F-box domain-containing protein n=3 Tax=Penicillium TaxID=5073 RepID=A0A9W4HGS7_PENNA|nr:unnamed protein product [Penicillium salamii]CAG7971350.1 unnamed protein product [Penicillium nalgiovense]CRL31333.1 Cyclin-like F-box [Penicillium camemberti]CAG7966051.1 unnamed protein product [Penicillium salamii]CAG7979453.1 unnamed protein product [Penicillium nalgiovense]
MGRKLESLPTEILRVVVSHLFIQDMKHLASASKRLRDVCLPYLFHNVVFSFSDSGLDGLRLLMQSDVRQYVVSFTYLIPELLRPETMDFEFFRCNILPPGNYAMWLKTDRSEPAELYVPYVLVYDTFSAICKEQQKIVENQEDAIALSAVFRLLPRLTELGLRFCQTLVQEHWVGCFMDQTVERYTYGHHLCIISNALKIGRDAGVFIPTVHLSGLELPYYCSLNTPKAHTLSIHLFGLLSCARNLRLSGSGSPMKSLSHTTLHLQQFDLCCLTVLQATLNEFLQNNMNSIESFAFHHVTLIGLGFTEEDSALISPEMCRSSLRMDWSIMYWTTSPCLVCGHDGWRVSKS